MHKLRIAFLLGIILFIGRQERPVAAAINTIYFDPPLQSIAVGESFRVRVETDMGEPHNVLQLMLVWDETVIQLESESVYGMNHLCDGCDYDHKEIRAFGATHINSFALFDGELLGVYSADQFIQNTTVVELTFRAIAPTTNNTQALQFMIGNPAPRVQFGTLFADADSTIRAFNSHSTFTLTVENPTHALDLDVSAGLNDFALRWVQQGAFTGEFAFYRVYRGVLDSAETFLSTTTGSTYSDDDPELEVGTTYCYQIEAVAQQGNVIGESAQVCASYGELTLVAPRQVVRPGDHDVPLRVKVVNATGLCILASDIAFTFDSSIITPTQRVETTALTYGSAFRSASSSAGHFKVSALDNNCTPLDGAGGLFDIYFDVVGEAGDETRIQFVNGTPHTVIYDAKDISQPVPLRLRDGVIALETLYTLGDCNGDGMTTSIDAYIALQIASGLLLPNSDQASACDLNGDTVVNAADAALLLCYAATQELAACGLGVMRDAVPSATPIIRWGIPQMMTETTRIPLMVESAADFAAGSLTINYDSADSKLHNVSTAERTTDFLLMANLEMEGLARIALGSDMPIGADGTILWLEVAGDCWEVDSADFQLSTVQLYDRYGREFTTNLRRDVDIEPTIPSCGVPTQITLQDLTSTQPPPALRLLIPMLLVATIVFVKHFSISAFQHFSTSASRFQRIGKLFSSLCRLSAIGLCVLVTNGVVMAEDTATTLCGNVQFQYGIAGSPRWVDTLSVTVDARPYDDDGTLFTNSVQTDANGAWCLEEAVLPARFDLGVSSADTLTNTVRNIAWTAEIIDVGMLIEGDVNNTGEIDDADLTLLLADYRRNDNPITDLDEDGIVGVSDVSLLRRNFGRVNP